MCSHFPFLQSDNLHCLLFIRGGRDDGFVPNRFFCGGAKGISGKAWVPQRFPPFLVLKELAGWRGTLFLAPQAFPLSLLWGTLLAQDMICRPAQVSADWALRRRRALSCDDSPAPVTCPICRGCPGTSSSHASSPFKAEKVAGLQDFCSSFGPPDLDGATFRCFFGGHEGES